MPSLSISRPAPFRRSAPTSRSNLQHVLPPIVGQRFCARWLTIADHHGACTRRLHRSAADQGENGDRVVQMRWFRGPNAFVGRLSA